MEHIGSFATSGYTLRDVQLFSDAEPRLAPLLAGCPVVRLAAGEAIEDTARACLYIVLRGALDVAMGDDFVGTALPGESAGEQSVLDEDSKRSRMSARGPTELLVIDGELVWQLIDQSNTLARNLLRLLSFRIRAANAQLRRNHKLGEFYRQLSMNDGLTGLYNRAWLSDMLPKLVASAQRNGTPLALVMIDLDHFKRFNDTHGHLAGDDALRAAAAVISAALRPADFAVRYGGEEMMVLLPDTPQDLALRVAERLCSRMRGASVLRDAQLPLPHVRASLGVAVLTEGMNDSALIAAADAALYRAKEAGRDRVSL
ncbi:MAG: GGDEF domain-containing protein [Gammaproteobacteria bacterium]